MTQKLWLPFTWEERRPILLDQFFYIPHPYDHGKVAPPSWREVFGNDHPVTIEYCSGNGQWIAGKAAEHPNRNWVAVEKRFDRAKQVWGFAKRASLPNLWVVCSEGQIYSRFYVPKASVSEVYVNFPDPWPKLRHAKHRLIQRPFLDALSPLLLPGGLATLATDHPEYAGQMIREFLSCPGWESVFADPHFISDWPGYGSSFFETLWKQHQLSLHFMQFRWNGV